MIENSTTQKKVCHVTSAHPRYDVRIFHKECKSLANNGFDVTLLVNDNLPNETIDKVKIVSTQLKLKNRLERMVKSKKKIQKLMFEIDADIYHFHDPELLSLALKCKSMNKIVIYDSHEDVPKQILVKSWIPKYLRKPVALIFKRYEIYASKRLSAIITPTPHIKDKFSPFNKLVVEVANFPLLEEFKYFEINENTTLKGCYIGGITKNRGIIQVCESMKLSGLDLNLAGGFVPKDLRNEITGNFTNVKYHGTLDRKGVVNILKDSSFGFVTLLPTPNHMDSYPIKMFEYMAAGIPVIASNFHLWKKIIEENNCGICVNPYCIEEITNAIEFYKTNNAKMREMGNNGRKAILEKYNWQIEEQKLLTLYNSL